MCRAVAGSACRWGARRGACPAGRRLTVPFRNPQGGLPFLSPANPDFSLLFCPPSPKGKDRPPAPFPSGEGGAQGYFMQGAPPLASPGLNPARHGKRGANHTPGRGLAFFVACLPCLYLLSCPHPPDPLPLRGRGSPKLFHARGSAPCIPGLKPGGTGEGGEPRTRRGGLPLRCRLTLPPLWYPAGGLPFLSPVCPAFSLLFCPHPPPTPFPSGEGGDYKFILPGASPPAPLHLTACGTYSPCHAGAPGLNPRVAAKPIEPPFYWQCRQPRRGGTGGEELRRLRWSSPPGQG